MSKKSDSLLHPAERELQNLKYKDLKIACIKRGMTFDQVVGGTIHSLQTFFITYFHAPERPELVEAFDDKMSETLQKRGHEKDSPLVNFRLSAPSETDNESGIMVIKIPANTIKEPKKPKREREEGTNIYKGTKKAFTFELTKKGMSIGDIIATVTERFPEAKEKSIKIWNKTALKS